MCNCNFWQGLALFLRRFSVSFKQEIFQASSYCLHSEWPASLVIGSLWMSRQLARNRLFRCNRVIFPSESFPQGLDFWSLRPKPWNLSYLIRSQSKVEILEKMKYLLEFRKCVSFLRARYRSTFSTQLLQIKTICIPSSLSRPAQ